MPESLSFLFAESLSPVPELLKDKFHRLVYKDLTSLTRIEKLQAWQLKDERPWLGWVQEGDVRRFYVCKLRVLKRYC
ncbi:hypothetical protein [uncultured Helicobacter sp.]|uniref:hypothetical protein n=1 Tax=uncultured Helicobacter sp. TaxID=175537 RepID=UPI002639EDE9|nr:hypothetical protein [uncultured Helicobacter sp.]